MNHDKAKANDTNKAKAVNHDKLKVNSINKVN